MKLVTKKSPRGRLFDELSPEQATAVGNVCGKGRVTSLAEKQLAEEVLRSMRDNDLWLSCGCRTTAKAVAALRSFLIPPGGGHIPNTVISL